MIINRKFIFALVLLWLGEGHTDGRARMAIESVAELPVTIDLYDSSFLRKSFGMRNGKAY
jgi:hypothetical protein